MSGLSPGAALEEEIASYGAEVILKDGGSIRLRTLSSADEPGVQEFFARLAPESRRYRFFATCRGAPPEEIRRLTSPDSKDTLALAAVSDEGEHERIVGIAEVTAYPPPADPTGSSRGEFAVAVADTEHGRGIGTVLLERVSAAARRAGIDELDAIVLADNTQMLDVFDRSGLALRRTNDQAQRVVTFSTRGDARFLAASVERERLAASESVRRLLAPRSIAVVGVSRREDSIGHAIVQNLVNARFLGHIYPVNPRETTVAGLRCFPAVSAIGAPVDLAVIAVPAKGVEEVVRDCATAKVRAVVVVSSGFGESSAEGRRMELRLRRLVRGAGMRMVGPNCMGVANVRSSVSMNATFSPVWPPEGNVSMLSQSGALGIAMLDHASKLNIGISDFVSVGNKADVSSNDLLSYWYDDPGTGVIALYLESFGNARKFARLAPEVSRRKPIVAVKSGRTAAGTRAAASHSAALASIDVGIDALFRQAGVIRTNTFEELFDVVALLSTQPEPKGPRVGVVTNAGGPGILLSDACESRGLTLPALSDDTLAALRRILPPQAGLSNPIDLIASATPEQYERAIELVGNDPAVDALVAIYIPPLVTDPDAVASAIARGAGTVPGDKPVATVFMSSKGAPALLAGGPRGKLPSYTFPENAALALSASLEHARFRARPRGEVATIPRAAERRIRSIIERRLSGSASGREWLPFEDVLEVLRASGIPFVETRLAAPDPDSAVSAARELGFPVVLKAEAARLVHKSDVGGVALNLASAEAVLDAAGIMANQIARAGLHLERFVLQRSVASSIEMLVGVTSDPGLGPILVTGLGGVHAELVGDVSLRLPPVSNVDARAMLDGLKAKRVFDGFRGAPPGDREALVDVLCKVSALVEIAPEIVELDLNPVKVLSPGNGAIVVDGRIRVCRPTRE